MNRSETLITRSREILGGEPVFSRTRVPVRSLLDYLAAGQSLDEFLDDFPTVNRADAIEILRRGAEVLIRDARSAG